MEMDLSRLRNELERSQKALSTAESSLATKEEAYNSLHDSLTKTLAELETARSQVVEEFNKRTSVESELQSANDALKALKAESAQSASSSASLEKDFNTLKVVHKEVEAKLQEATRLANTKSHELQDLETQLAEAQKIATQNQAEAEDLRDKLERAEKKNRELTGTNAVDDEAVDEIEDSERARLREKVRQLEATLEAERKRHKQHQAYPQPAAHSHPHPHARNFSVASSGGFLEDDDVDFGEVMQREMEAHRAKEEADRTAAIKAEEERKRLEKERLERIREVKRGLEKWKGWRMDLTVVGGSSGGLGEVFEV